MVVRDSEYYHRRHKISTSKNTGIKRLMKKRDDDLEIDGIRTDYQVVVMYAGSVVMSLNFDSPIANLQSAICNKR